MGVDVVSAATTDTTTPAEPANPTTPAKPSTPSKSASPTIQKEEILSIDTYPNVLDPTRYIDGTYSAYGSSSVYGAERVDVIIKHGVLADVMLYKLQPNHTVAGKSYDWQNVLNAIPRMTNNFISKGFYFETGKADAVSGATNSANSWNLAVQRAFSKASKVQPKNKYFNGTFSGVDSNTRVLVCADIQSDKVTKVLTYLFGPNDKILGDYQLTPTQKDIISKLNDDLLKNNVKASCSIKGAESIWSAAKAAYSSMLANASRK